MDKESLTDTELEYVKVINNAVNVPDYPFMVSYISTSTIPNYLCIYCLAQGYDSGMLTHYRINHDEGCRSELFSTTGIVEAFHSCPEYRSEKVKQAWKIAKNASKL